ncbi:MAG: hypothetical protein K1X89_10240 [Myxococcaceae bacterium]|nr:hypothetical protein [Myxococcaceae bacterium]
MTRQLQTRRQVARTLYSGGMELRFCETPMDVERVISADKPGLLIIDADTVDPSTVQDALGQWMRKSPPRGPTILLSLGENKEPLFKLLQTYEVANLIAKHGAIRAVFPLLDERELLVTAQKVLRKDIFGVEKYVGIWGVPIHRHVLRSMSDKYDLTHELEGFLTDLEVPSSVVPDMVTVADELMVNAIVHAPRTPKGEPKYEHLGPDPKLVLEPAEYGEVTWACDGQRFMFGVSDPFGSLSRERVNQYVAKSFSPSKQAIETKSSGAGLGLAMAVKRVHQLVFNIREHERTEVLAGWYLRVENAGEFRQVSRSLNVFWLSPEVSLTQEMPALAPPPTALAPKPGAAVRPPARTPPPAPSPSKVHPQPSRALEPRPTGSAATVKVSSKGLQVLELKGWIDERTTLPETTAARLDMRGVVGFTSPGVVRWLNFVRGLKGRPVELVAAPESLVRLAAQVDGMVGGMKVRSVLSPHECGTCGTNTQLERKLERAMMPTDFPCPHCGGKVKFVGVEQEYRSLQEMLGAVPGR